MSLAAQFIETPQGRLFVVERAPVSKDLGNVVLCVQPLAEEMNKARSLIAELGAALAREGATLIVADLYGTGDSEGDFQDASIDLWCRNLDAVADWIAARGMKITSIVAVRFGCMLAARWIKQSARRVSSTVFWQPTTSGSQIVNQWLRLLIAASVFDGQGKRDRRELEAELEAGESLVVGGYVLTPTFASELRALDLRELLGPELGALYLFEVGDATGISVSLMRLMQDHAIRDTAVVPGDAFWTATEIVRNPTLVARTLGVLIGSAV